ncbi:uncharacterized protein LOC131672053, partial [Phymastichus coffea]|uniref:uncharacterized protein LOC131672053 n=1 Tax=Phymastichus coffea TaxID=108790 RepID=UPI00273A94F4
MHNVEDYEVKHLTFFVKSLPESDVIQDIVSGITFEEELNFYKNIKPLMALNSESDRWSPKCYLAENNVLVFEDLRAQGFSMNSEKIMDERLLKSALVALARFHASTLVAESKLGKPLNEAFPEFLKEKIFDKSTIFGRSTLLGFKTLVSIADKFNLDASFVLPHMYDYIHKNIRSQEGELNVLCHSDLWNNNILFNENVVPECIIVDYQMLRYTTPVVDLSALLYFNTTSEFRKKFEFEMIRYYYSIFQETLGRRNIKIKVPSYEIILNTYTKYRLIGMM